MGRDVTRLRGLPPARSDRGRRRAGDAGLRHCGVPSARGSVQCAGAHRFTGYHPNRRPYRPRQGREAGSTRMVAASTRMEAAGRPGPDGGRTAPSAAPPPTAATRPAGRGNRRAPGAGGRNRCPACARENRRTRAGARGRASAHMPGAGGEASGACRGHGIRGRGGGIGARRWGRESRTPRPPALPPSLPSPPRLPPAVLRSFPPFSHPFSTHTSLEADSVTRDDDGARAIR